MPPHSHHPIGSGCKVLRRATALPLAAARTLLLCCAAFSPLAAAPTLPAAPAQAPAQEEEVVLSPFEVTADASDTYNPNNTNSITGTSTSLDRTPLDARVFNRMMMDELDVVDVASMLTAFGGLGSPLFGAGSEDQRGMQEGDTLNYGNMTSRGLTISNPRRDGFLRSDTSLMDSFDVESAEALQGSNSFLFGSGDAGGVVNINSKRARLRQNFAKLAARFDSEGSDRYTFDGNAGTAKFAVRLNAVRGNDYFDRPIISLHPKGVHVAATLRPLPWLSVYAEHRDFTRDHIRPANATVRAPSTLRMPNGETIDGQMARYITGLGGSELIDNFITLTNQDSLTGVYTRHYYENTLDAVAVELTPNRDLALQFRYGVDDRVNRTTAPSSTSVYHPYATGNAYRDEAGVLKRVWAMNTSLNVGPSYQVARGFKFTGVYHKDLGRWGDHWFNTFHSRQEQRSGQYSERFYETDANGAVIQNAANIANTESGRTVMPATWMEVFPTSLIGGLHYPGNRLVHPNGKTYRLQQQVYEGAVPSTPGNPLGLSGPVNAATGQTTTSYLKDVTRENSTGVSALSSFWRGRIDTMAGFRFESANLVSLVTNEVRGPVDYDSMTLGTVFDTPVRGLRGYVNYATNARITYGTTTDINNQPLPIGKGVTREAGLKFALWDQRLSGNLSVYESQGRNFPGSLGAVRDDVDPDGINGRHGGSGFVYDKTSDGISVALTARPLRWWQATLGFTTADGSERSDVRLPVLYNDEFNTMTSGGQTVVAVKGASGSLAPLLVPSAPGNAASPQVPLTLAMMRDAASPYFAVLDPDSGRIQNAQQLGLLATGVGTGRTGLPITSHQLGFTPPVAAIVVREAGEKTTGYAENALSLVNRFEVREGWLRGTVFGWSLVYRAGIRGYSYNDAADGNRRKVFEYPDQTQHNFFAVHRLRLGRWARVSLQVNVANVFDRQEVVALPRSTTGAVRYFAYQYSPRKTSFTASVDF